MPFPHIRKLDLSLVWPLYALLDERHVTRAAQRCDMSQSAMSRALGRLRSALDDEPLVRSGAAYERTPRGDQLLVDLQALLPRLDAAVRGNRFDPATSTDRLCIATTDFAASVLIPTLLERMASAAPSVRIEVVPWNDRVFNDIEAGRTHLALIGVQPPEPFESKPLFTDEFVCVVAENHPLRARLTLKRYVEHGHAVVTIGKHGGQPWIERALAANGCERRVEYPFALSAVSDSRSLANQHDLYDSAPSGEAAGPCRERPPPGRASRVAQDRISYGLAPSPKRRRGTQLAA